MIFLLALSACEPNPYGVYASAIQAQRKSVDATPCNAETVRTLGATLVEAGDAPAAMQVFRDFEGACAQDEVLMGKHLDLAIQSGLHDEAIELAQALSKGDPSSVYSEKLVSELMLAGRREEATSLVRARVALSGTKGDDDLRAMATNYEARNNHCAALISWMMLQYASPELRKEAATAATRLEKAHPECESVLVKEKTTVREKPGDGYWQFQTQMGGQEIWLAADRSAAWTYVDQEAFEGVEGAEQVETLIRLSTAFGYLEGPLYQVDSITMGELVIEDIEVVVVPEVPDDIDGFLGLNLSSRMGMTKLDEKRWEVTPY